MNFFYEILLFFIFCALKYVSSLNDEKIYIFEKPIPLMLWQLVLFWCHWYAIIVLVIL